MSFVLSKNQKTEITRPQDQKTFQSVEPQGQVLDLAIRARDVYQLNTSTDNLFSGSSGFSNQTGSIRLFKKPRIDPWPFPGQDDVSSTVDLNFSKSRIDMDRDRLRMYPPSERTGGNYLDDVRLVLRRYFDLIEEVYQFWPRIIEAKKNGGDRDPYPDIDLVYDDWDYQRVVREIWDDAREVLRDFERYNPGRRRMREDTVGYLYRSIQYSDLTWESVFYSSLASEISMESF